MPHSGSCHCGKISYEVEGEIDQVIECNCSHCSRKGYLLWFVPRDSLRFRSGAEELATYTFNKRHRAPRPARICSSRVVPARMSLPDVNRVISS